MTNALKKTIVGSAAALAMSGVISSTVNADEHEETEAVETTYLTVNTEPLLSVPEAFPSQFKYDSGVDIAYPEDGVKGIFVTANSAGGSRMDTLTDLLNNTELNSMVIDIKEDYGDITMPIDSDHELVQEKIGTG